MGSVYEEFESELEGWNKKYAGHPRQHMIRLFLLALEREEIVSVGYREELISARLNVMPIPAEAREILRHALLWIWKDEEMHAIYIRGVILKLGNLPLRVRAFTRQLAGALGGWSTSVRQHLRWSDAPLSRILASLVTFTGLVTGRVPHSVRRHLDYSSFKDFCLFNVDAEKTAWLCWNRLIELTSKQHDLQPALIDDFRRIMADEQRHCRIFEILASVLKEDDNLLDEETAHGLSEKIAAVGEFFLPRKRRSQSENPLGTGGPVWVAQGSTPDEKISRFRGLLREAGLADQVRKRATSLNKAVHDLRVAIKPTFMLGYNRKDRSIITDPDLLHELASFLRDCGCTDIALVEAGNLYDEFYANRSVHDVARYFDISSPYYRVVDLSAEQVPHSYSRGMAQYTVGETWKSADFRISFAKMRSHPVELVYLSVCNLESIGTRCDEFIFTERQAQRETSVMMLLDEFPAQFAIIDAYAQAADGLAGVMGCPRPVVPLRYYAGVDALAVDMVAARHMGMTDPRESSFLRSACQWFGDPENNTRIKGLDEPIPEWRSPYHNEVSTILSFLALPVYVLASGRGSLFVPEMDREAFPLLHPETISLRFGRPLIQTLLGLRH